jgi:DnaJ-class molecular chaperone
VLSDPGRRQDYNHSLRTAEGSVRQPVTVRSAPAAAEPLVPEKPAVSILSDADSIRLSFESHHERLLRNFTGPGVPKGERIEGLNLDLVLTPEEAARGLALRVRVPALHRCPACGGSGFDWAFPCSLCDQQGVVQEDEAGSTCP